MLVFPSSMAASTCRVAAEALEVAVVLLERASNPATDFVWFAGASHTGAVDVTDPQTSEEQNFSEDLVALITSCNTPGREGEGEDPDRAGGREVGLERKEEEMDCRGKIKIQSTMHAYSHPATGGQFNPTHARHLSGQLAGPTSQLLGALTTG
ncbi:hypothetical protein VPH35_021038 [Triticum aestivum]